MGTSSASAGAAPRHSDAQVAAAAGRWTHSSPSCMCRHSANFADWLVDSITLLTDGNVPSLPSKNQEWFWGTEPAEGASPPVKQCIFVSEN